MNPSGGGAPGSKDIGIGAIFIEVDFNPVNRTGQSFFKADFGAPI
jgi:hypothetical protein